MRSEAEAKLQAETEAKVKAEAAAKAGSESECHVLQEGLLDVSTESFASKVSSLALSSRTDSKPPSSLPSSAAPSQESTPRNAQPKKLVPLPPKGAAAKQNSKVQATAVAPENGNTTQGGRQSDGADTTQGGRQSDEADTTEEALALGVHMWAAELGVKVVSDVVISGDAGTARGEDAYDDDFEEEDALGASSELCVGCRGRHCVCVCVCVFMYVCMCVYIYIYIRVCGVQDFKHVCLYSSDS